MSKFFKDVQKGAGNLEQEFLGPTYSYHSKIRSPDEMGMSSAGNLNAMGKNISGILGYSQLLIEGGGRAQKPNGVLGNKFFLKTGGKCKDSAGKEHERYLYFNNQADGNYKLGGMNLGKSFSNFKGVIPSIMQTTGELNPLPMFGAFMQGSKPACRKIRMDTVDKNDRKSSAQHYVADADIGNMDECWFPNGKNPVNGNSCPESFISANKYFNKLKKKRGKFELKDKPLANAVNAGFGALLIYFLYKIMYSKN